MFTHQHPYSPFIPDGASKLIVGTIPPPRFSTGQLFEDDVNFCYGSKYGLLWPILEKIFNRQISYENSDRAITERKELLIDFKIGICDMVEECYRDKIDASDLGMKRIINRDLISILKLNPKVEKILFMGGNSKNGPEYLFRNHLRDQNMRLIKISDDRPRIHEFSIEGRKIKTVSLISPSSAANRSIGSYPDYKLKKSLDTKYSTLNFRIEQYKKHFV
ncbi:uracil-DNA glycosylase family protein [Lutimonas saemankumensis]|uniref:uracil-DNA glycosylase family protein n=1 Tax=Lutimonas saemankumensis TaxID=483016 RepID=UPI001CD668CC|nr:uracil-DNA glycosylase family protein [Lutimonas saemankumensis]MCA0930925.1 uracil-DNA glycosylase family protein [Lutimonas saemankumensis]